MKTPTLFILVSLVFLQCLSLETHAGLALYDSLTWSVEKKNQFRILKQLFWMTSLSSQGFKLIISVFNKQFSVQNSASLTVFWPIPTPGGRASLEMTPAVLGYESVDGRWVQGDLAVELHILQKKKRTTYSNTRNICTKPRIRQKVFLLKGMKDEYKAMQEEKIWLLTHMRYFSGCNWKDSLSLDFLPVLPYLFKERQR